MANLSACDPVNSKGFVACLRGKSEEEMLAITKVRTIHYSLEEHGVRGSGALPDPQVSHVVSTSSCPCCPGGKSVMAPPGESVDTQA